MVLRMIVLDPSSYVLVPSTLPTLATTVLRARCTVRLRTGTSGLVLCTIRRVPTAWASVAAVSVRRATAIVATVAPYAAPRSRVDSSFNFLRTGQYYRSDGYILAYLTGGHWWLSAVASEINAHHLGTLPTNILTQGNNRRGLGFAIRCVTREG